MRVKGKQNLTGIVLIDRKIFLTHFESIHLNKRGKGYMTHVKEGANGFSNCLKSNRLTSPSNESYNQTTTKTATLSLKQLQL